jgi:tellurite resistance protein TerC
MDAISGNWPLIGFIAFILAMLAIDLGLFNRKDHEVKPKEAALLVSFWVSLAIAFNIGIYMLMGTEKGLQFTTGYLIEQSLSVDNMFVFLLVMRAFAIPKKEEHKLLFFGILGAIILRGVLIAAGVALLHQFHWLFYAFGAFLIYTAFRVITSDDEAEADPQNNPIVKWVTNKLPTLKNNHLLLALICLELTDVLFAMDSIPAIFAITDDPFILFTSNIFAILGLRSLYFLLSHAIGKFHLLKYGVGLILGFVGVKMIARDVMPIPMLASLAVIILVLAASVGLSLVVPKRGTKPSER